MSSPASIRELSILILDLQKTRGLKKGETL